MATPKFTVLYPRISKEDVLLSENEKSISIENQRLFLTDYAKKNKFKNVKIIIDDGITGAIFDRSGFNELFDLIEAKMVDTLIVKDLSRLGRNYLECGKLIEEFFPLYDVRFIAVNDNVDSKYGYDDCIPFKNIMNEMYCKDISRKVKLSLKLKDKQGLAVATNAPYGYIKDPENRKKWIIDTEAAEVVKKIFNLRQELLSVNKIADILKNEKILIPSQYMKKFISKKPKSDCSWTHENVTRILKNRSYTGDVINFKTYKKSYKIKGQFKNPVENQKVHIDVHEPIIERSVWEDIQKSFSLEKIQSAKTYR